jgi:hypothetical protein
VCFSDAVDFNVGCPAREAKYVFGVTHGRYGWSGVKKLRVVLILEDDLWKFLEDDFYSVICQTRPEERERCVLLRKMAVLWRRERDLTKSARPTLNTVTVFSRETCSCLAPSQVSSPVA